MSRKMTFNSVMKTVQGCDGYSMDLAECRRALRRDRRCSKGVRDRDGIAMAGGPQR